jgi:hypothetical protein
MTDASRFVNFGTDRFAVTETGNSAIAVRACLWSVSFGLPEETPDPPRGSRMFAV